MHSTKKRIGAMVGASVVAFTLTTIAHAQPKQPSAAAKDTARTLLLDCRAKTAKKDLEGALKSCEGAHSIMGVPTTGLELAKVKEAMGRLVEARETALEVVRFDNSGNNTAFSDAQAEANKLSHDLEKRIPSLVITVSGLPSGKTARVVVDSDEVPAAALSLPFRVNPGDHTIVASAPDLPDATRTVSVKEGQSIPVEFDLAASSSQDKPSPGRNIPTWAWIVGGVGLVGAAGAVYFGIDFADTKDRVDRDCPNDQCNATYTTEEAKALQSHWNQALGLTVASGAIGAACLGAAIYGFASAPKKDAATATRIVPWIGRDVSGIVFSGSF